MKYAESAFTCPEKELVFIVGKPTTINTTADSAYNDFLLIDNILSIYTNQVTHATSSDYEVFFVCILSKLTRADVV